MTDNKKCRKMFSFSNFMPTLGPHNSGKNVPCCNRCHVIPECSANTGYSAGGELLTSIGDIVLLNPTRLPMRKRRLRTLRRTHPSCKLNSLR